MSFKDKVVIVTGAASGIGAATALRLAKLSAQLALVDKDEDKLKISLAVCEKQSNTKHLAIVADLSKHEEVVTVIPNTIKRFGKLDVLINGAGIFSRESVLSGDFTKNYKAVMAVNLEAPIILTNKAAPYLVATKGNIVNISSIASQLAKGRASLYAVSKAGLEIFSKCMAVELASKGVRVNSVHPGVVRTNILANMEPNITVDEHYRDLAQKLPFGIIEPEEIATLIAFLASDEARSISGSSYVIDGAFTLLRITTV